MTLTDLFRGDWTWTALLREVYPVVLVAVVSYIAGHERGWNRGFMRAFHLMDARHSEDR